MFCHLLLACTHHVTWLQARHHTSQEAIGTIMDVYEGTGMSMSHHALCAQAVAIPIWHISMLDLYTTTVTGNSIVQGSTCRFGSLDAA